MINDVIVFHVKNLSVRRFDSGVARGTVEKCCEERSADSPVDDLKETIKSLYYKKIDLYSMMLPSSDLAHVLGCPDLLLHNLVLYSVADIIR